MQFSNLLLVATFATAVYSSPFLAKRNTQHQAICVGPYPGQKGCTPVDGYAKRMHKYKARPPGNEDYDSCPDCRMNQDDVASGGNSFCESKAKHIGGNESETVN
ncbi:hypothetical protein HYALB_00002951 [Hymenoscyphus albidus]|uniref:Uncharacterized protein n=1 Tax=Hymenoscyphus albidus TaxID=595503 RepID=A0A9N9Q1Z6_9HELO|nr:hypothetical protein HYALB_00002951 [Hymenoscyphus albidus]